ncbi:MAG: hypothetical protein WD801_11315 [Gemmatimonadaceae bacterium]
MRYVNRRTFTILAALGAGLLLAGCKQAVGPLDPEQELIDDATIELLPTAPTETTVPGMQALGLGTPRDGFLYVPANYNPAEPAPLLVLLHGAGGSGSNWDSEELRMLYDAFGLLVLAPDSRFQTWDMLSVGRYKNDVDFLQSALEKVFRIANVDGTRLTIGGFSDGASEALGIGLVNAHLFSRVIAFSPGQLIVPFRRGQPEIYMTHGNLDDVVPFTNTRDFIVPVLRANGHDVDFHTFEGGHEMPFDLRNNAIEWAAELRTTGS